MSERRRVRGWGSHLAAGRYRGARRVAGISRRLPHRFALTGVAAAALLIGGGALAATLPHQSARLSTEAGRAATPAALGAQRSGAPETTRGLSAARAPAGEPEPDPVVSAEPPSPPDQPTTSPGATAPRPPVALSYEAETAELSGFVRIFTLSDASGDAVVGMIGLHPDSHVRFTGITIEEPGEYELTLYYVSGPDREAYLRVNDGEQELVEFPGTDSDQAVAELTLPVTLVAGDNELWFGNPGSRGPSLDRITISG